MRLLAAAMLAVSTLAVPAFSCSCVSPQPVCSVYWATPVLFLGRITHIDHEGTQEDHGVIVPGKFVVHFEILKSYRGGGGTEKELVVRTNDQGSACGFPFAEGHDYLVYAGKMQNGQLATGACNRTHEVTDRANDADLAWIEGLPKAPQGVSIFGRIQSHAPNEQGGLDSAGMPGIRVSIAGPQMKSLTSDADGNFRADGLPPGKYSITASVPGRYAALPAREATLQNQACADIEWSTRLDGHIRGHVYFSDGSPAEGLYLTAKSADAKPNEPWTWRSAYVRTGAGGAFDFDGLAPGSYIFAVNMDFAGLDPKSYYRRVFYPAAADPSGAAVLTVDAGSKIENLRFFLPADVPAPSAALHVQVLDFDGQPVPGAEILAYDSAWSQSVTPVTANAGADGETSITLRPGQHYDIEAITNRPNGQDCAEPVSVEASDGAAPVVLRLSHHFGNCMQFKKR